MRAIAARASLPYLLVFKANEEGERYVFDPSESPERFKLGDVYRWEDEDLPPYVEAAMKSGSDGLLVYEERIHFSSAEKVLSIIRGHAYYTEGRKQTAYIAMCYSLNELAAERWRFLFITGGSSLIMLALFCLFFAIAARVAVTVPVRRVTASVMDFVITELGIDNPKICERRTENEIAMLSDSILSLQKAVRDYSSRLAAARKKAATDALTGLYNRESLSDGVTDFLLPHGSPSACSFLIADIDHFKRVNDKFGHAAGDEALRRAANALRSMFRAESAGDIVARFGGDEFAVFCKGLGDTAVIANKLNTLRAELSKITLPDGTPLTMSVGVAVAAEDARGVTYKKLYDLADAVLYEVKHRGRDGYGIRLLENKNRA
jgi:diguanylate cyclase (GGDEF)-like protein